jgi:hypothetical protein
MKMEGGGGKINLSKKENTIANTLCSLSLSLSLRSLSPAFSAEFNVYVPHSGGRGMRCDDVGASIIVMSPIYIYWRNDKFIYFLTIF